MARQSTRIKKYLFAAGRASAIGLVFAGLFWAVVVAFLLWLVGFSKPFWAILEIICTVIALVCFIGAFIAWKQFGRMARNNKQQEQEENQLELERDYVLVTCPKCNGSNKIRRSTVEKCRYCDTYIQG